MPGFVAVGSVAVLWPSTLATGEGVAVLALAAPALGFALHQFFRVGFEATGGFARRSRTSLDALMELAQSEQHRVDRWQAFMAWEVTFYGSAVPEAFRSHDRGGWHYILSFWSIAFAAGVSFVLAVVAMLAGFAQCGWLSLAGLVVGQAVVGLGFFWKGRQTFSVLVAQETAVIRLYRDAFADTLRKLQASGVAGPAEAK